MQTTLNNLHMKQTMQLRILRQEPVVERDQAGNPKYAIVVPCYNEEKRLPFQQFLSFAREHSEVILCFVNDGSRDNTLEVLRNLQKQCPENICVYNLPQNGGKSEAVRQGMLFVYNNYSVTMLGFLDADLATLPEEWLEMAKYKETRPQY
ncbi:MAG: glycosyltransferase, partial [Bacteroidetes bacterium]